MYVFKNTMYVEKDSEISLMKYKNLRVLVADDNEINREVFREFLSEYEIDVALAEDGTEAVELCKHKGFDIIFMDCRMPLMDGCEATNHIRKLSKFYAQIPIYAVSANVEQFDPQFLKNEDLTGFIAKPISFEKIEDCLEESLIHSTKEKVPSMPLVVNEPGLPVIDWDVLTHIATVTGMQPKEVVLQNEVVNRILGIFSRNSKIQLDEIVLAVSLGNLKVAADVAHKLQGSARNVGGKRLAHYCQLFENCLKNKEAESVNVLKLQKELTELLSQLGCGK